MNNTIVDSNPKPEYTSNLNGNELLETGMNLTDLKSSVNFLQLVTKERLNRFFTGQPRKDGLLFTDKNISLEYSLFKSAFRQHPLNCEELIILLLALVPHIQPNFLDSIIQKFLPQGGDFPEIGGTKGDNHRSMLPTGETAQFILAGNDIANRLRVTGYFSPQHFFHIQNILSLEPVKEGEPRMSGRIILSQEYIDLLTVGRITPPVFNADFPAKKIETLMTWDDLVLHQTTLSHVTDIKIWLEHNKELERDAVLSRKIKKGYRVLFYGPPGTGKTLTASLLGKQFGKDVYRIDLSQVVSKYIGETEKNMEKVFSKAENKDWILFFDEADALFGKRSNVSSAHDKYANQEVSYLLQRVEDYPGLIVLASNYRNNIDQAFVRRFNAIVHFPMPDPEERLSIWKNNIPASIPLEDENHLKTYAYKFELSGSAISNIMQYAALCALSNGGMITNSGIEHGIKRELLKTDKMFY